MDVLIESLVAPMEKLKLVKAKARFRGKTKVRRIRARELRLFRKGRAQAIWDQTQGSVSPGSGKPVTSEGTREFRLGNEVIPPTAKVLTRGDPELSAATRIKGKHAHKVTFEQMKFGNCSGNEVDVSEILPSSQLEAIKHRMRVRSLRLRKVAARHQIPISAVRTIIESDRLSEEEIRNLQLPYITEQNEKDLAEMANDTAAFDVGSPASKEEVGVKLDALIESALGSMQISDDGEKRQFRELVRSYKDVFALTLGENEAARIRPMEVELIPGAVPRKFKFRTTTNVAAQQALEREVKILENLGIIRRNTMAVWVAPTMLVPKPGKPGEWRVVIDLRWINSNTLPIQFQMPDLEQETRHTEGAKYFFCGDFLKGFWQIPLSQRSQHLYSFATPSGVFSYTRIPMGASSSPAYFQAVMMDIFSGLVDSKELLIWIDDMLGFAKTFPQYLEVLKRIFAKCREFNLKLNVEKTMLGDVKAHWCGRDINGQGVSMNARSTETFTNMPDPINAGELGEFLNGLGWMSKCLLRFAEFSAPLRELLTKAKTLANSQKKRSYGKIDLKSIGWSTVHSEAFVNCKKILGNSIETIYPKDDGTYCLFTDASDRYYAGLLTWVGEWDNGKKVMFQAHRPAGTFSGEFVGSAVRWSTIEKESFPIIRALSEWEHILLMPRGFRVYCDHANIVSLWKPDTINPPLSRSALDKVHRWLYTLSYYKITHMEHLPGQDNIWADMLSRWGQPGYHVDRKEKETIKVKAFQNRFLNLEFAALAPDEQLPSIELVRLAQQEDSLDAEDIEFFETQKGSFVLKEGVWYYKDRIWIPAKAEELILRHLVTAHCGIAGHRGVAVTTQYLEKTVFWETLEQDVNDFVRDTCLCCIKGRDGRIVPRQWGNTLHATKPAKLLSFDFLYIGIPPKDGSHSYVYILVLKDHYSGLVELIPCSAANHEITVEAILYWCARYGYPELLQSDRGSHFKNGVMAELAAKMPAEHHFTLAYCPWSNGSVERVNKEIVPLLKMLQMEHNMRTGNDKGKLKFQDWPFFLPMIMGILNSSPSVRLDGKSPREVFMGLEQYNPVHLIYAPRLGHISDVPLEKGNILAQVEKLQDSLAALHVRVDVSTERIRLANRKQFARRHRKNPRYKRNHKKAEGLPPQADIVEDVDLKVDFQVGDFVMVAIPERPSSHKLEAYWRGPYRVMRTITELVYEVQHLGTMKLSEAHTRRIKFFCDGELDVSVALTDHIMDQESTLYTVEAIERWRYNREKMAYEVKIKWLGFSALENTWELLTIMHEDVPAVVLEFLDGLPDKIRTAMRNALGL